MAVKIENNETNIEKREAPPEARRGRIFTGILLITIGAGYLLFRWLGLMGFFPLCLGVGMLLGGAVTRRGGWIVAGGILLGAGLGIALQELNWPAAWLGLDNGAVFLLAFALGWFTIPLVTWLSMHRADLWPVIWGVVMAAIGGLLMLGNAGASILQLIERLWPVALILAGALLLAGWWRRRG